MIFVEDSFKKALLESLQTALSSFFTNATLYYRSEVAEETPYYQARLYQWLGTNLGGLQAR